MSPSLLAPGAVSPLGFAMGMVGQGQAGGGTGPGAPPGVSRFGGPPSLLMAQTRTSSQVPVELVLLLTVPVVDPDKDDLNWKRPLNCLHILTSPLLCILTLKSGACKSLGWL